MASKIKWFGKKVMREIEKETNDNLIRAADFLVGEVKKSLKQPGTGRTYDWEFAAGGKVWKWLRMPNGKLIPVKKRAKPHTASAPGKPPATDHGQYSQSITREDPKRHGKIITIKVGTNKKVGKWLEFGTRYMAPRPHFRPAFNKNLNKLKKIIAGKA